LISPSDADFSLVDYSQFPVQVYSREAGDRLTEGCVDGILGGRMQSEADDAWRWRGRISEHIAKVGVQRDENSSGLYGCRPYHRIFGAGETEFYDRNTIVT